MNLVPFPGTNSPYSIAGSAELSYSHLYITFNVLGPIRNLKKITEPAGPPQRKNDLWKTTCFEWFLKSADSPSYWECNLSPSGEWNLYKLDDYRKNLQEEKLIKTYSTFESSCHEKDYLLDCSFDLSPLALPSGKYRLSLSVVLENLDGEKSYWSLIHTQKQPDFHHPRHFVMDIGKEN